MTSTYLCLLLFCSSGTQPIKECPFYLGPPNETQNDKIAELIVKKGAPITVCGEEVFVKDNVIYKVRFQ